MMKADRFSQAVAPRLVRISLWGFILSIAGIVIGAIARRLLEGNVSTFAIAGRVTAAAIYGFGLGFSALFLILGVAGGLYVMRSRKP